jgi:hypothetical protein
MRIMHTNCVHLNAGSKNSAATNDETPNFAPLYIRRRFDVSLARARTIAELLTGGGVE